MKNLQNSHFTHMKTFISPFVKIALLLLFAVLMPTLVHAQWSASVNLSPSAVSAGLNESMGSCIGTNGDTVHVVWTDKLSSTKATLYYTRSVDTGLTWSNPIAITSLNGNAWNPAIAVNGTSVHVVWRELNPVNNHRASYYKHSLDGGDTWGTNMYLDSTADWPAVAVSGNTVYMVNDSVTAASPYNTEIFFMRSLNNGTTWSTKKQLTFSVGRSEDEAIAAQGSHVHMSWNDNRSGQFQILYKESNDYGETWGPDVVVIPQNDYGTMVSVDGAHVDVVAAGHPTSNHYQILLAQSNDTGATWGTNSDITNDVVNTYYYPDMVRNGSDLHVVCGSSTGAKYLHSGDGGTTWDTPFTFTGSSTFVAFSKCVLHIIYVDANKKINYLRNPTGNAGHCTVPTDITDNQLQEHIAVYPNPFSTQTMLQANSVFKDASLFVYNSLGKRVKQFTHISGQAFTLYRDNLPCGIYFLELTQDNKTYMTDKLIITDK